VVDLGGRSGPLAPPDDDGIERASVPWADQIRDRVRHRRGEREMDGLDFRTSDGGCVRLQLLLDGGPHPKRVFVGAKMLEPPHAHFQLCP